jgi:hypothetical protein
LLAKQHVCKGRKRIIRLVNHTHQAVVRADSRKPFVVLDAFQPSKLRPDSAALPRRSCHAPDANASPHRIGATKQLPTRAVARLSTRVRVAHPAAATGVRRRALPMQSRRLRLQRPSHLLTARPLLGACRHSVGISRHSVGIIRKPLQALGQARDLGLRHTSAKPSGASGHCTPEGSLQHCHARIAGEPARTSR